MKRAFAPFILGVVFAAVVFAILAGAGVFGSDDDDDDDRAGTAATARTAARTATTEREESPPPAARPPAAAGSVADIYERVSPGVALIQSTTRTPLDPLEDPEGSSGSGFVIDAGKGLIVTNQHVVDKARTVSVRFGEDGEPIDAKVLGTDPSTDLAVLQVDPKDAKEDLVALELGTSKGLRPGDPTIAIGSPFGLGGTVTTGIVSSLGRTIQSPNNFQIEDVIQTDAAINPGNSGGPLLDGQGRVIGVNSQIATTTRSNSGVGFAVPVDTLKEVVPVLETEGEIRRAYLGVRTSEYDEAIADRLQLDTTEGALVRTVVPSGPADDAGLRELDVITSVAGQAVDEPDDVADVVEQRKPGETVDVEVLRRGREQTLKVRLGERPNEPVSP
jgi:S1-C subfamily serine protease